MGLHEVCFYNSYLSHSPGTPKLSYKSILGAANFQPRKCFVWCFYSENTFLEAYCYFALEHSCLVLDIEVLGLKHYVFFNYFSVLDRYPSAPPFIRILGDVPTLRRLSRALWLSARGWFCQHHNKSPWLSRPCSSRLSSCPGCLASAVGRRKTDLTPTTAEKVEQSHF